MSNAVVVIPVYQASLSDRERLSLDQCLRVLPDATVHVAAPEGFPVSRVLAGYHDRITVRFFHPAYFENIAGYNRLMTSVAFYKAFGSYEYLLLYQLDAYLFRNDLAKWCGKGYDYIGAPAFNTTDHDYVPAGQADAYAGKLASNRLVFNGGLSLRRIPAMIRFLNVYNTFYSGWKGNEDMLFSLSATRLLPLKPLLRLPSWKEALSFSFERSPAASFELTDRQLPFGCHAWERYDPRFWRAYIPEV